VENHLTVHLEIINLETNTGRWCLNKIHTH